MQPQETQETQETEEEEGELGRAVVGLIQGVDWVVEAGGSGGHPTKLLGPGEWRRRREGGTATTRTGGRT